MKISNNAEKYRHLGKKQVWRITRNSDGKSEGDYIALWDERPDQLDELFMFHPVYTYINKTVTDFTARPILQTIFEITENACMNYQNFKRLKRTKRANRSPMGRIQTYLEPRAISSRPLKRHTTKIGKYCGNQRRSAS